MPCMITSYEKSLVKKEEEEEGEEEEGKMKMLGRCQIMNMSLL